MKLVFADEFERNGPPDPAKWTHEIGFIRNQEPQWYQKENVWCENGLLVIEGRRERKLVPERDLGSADWRKNRLFASFTSGSIKTKGLHSWTFGRFEGRMKIEPLKGLWPAFWTVGDFGRWPSNGEIDIMEFYQDHLHANTAYGEGSAIWDSVRKPMSHFTAKDPRWAEKFHIWRMDWDERSIRLYIDGELLNETDITNTRNPDGRNPFHGPHHIILNLAVGATGGDPSGLVFPRRFLVDWVRVWQNAE